MKPEFIEYPNAQILMIGEAQDHLGKAATAEGNKQEHEEEPGQELEKLEQENEKRVEALQGKFPAYSPHIHASFNRKSCRGSDCLPRPGNVRKATSRAADELELLREVNNSATRFFFCWLHK